MPEEGKPIDFAGIVQEIIRSADRLINIFPVSVLVRGETLSGRARAVLDDPDYTQRVFAKLRPNAIEGFGTLVEIRLEPTPAL